jgi:hypothetical protein
MLQRSGFFQSRRPFFAKDLRICLLITMPPGVLTRSPYRFTRKRATDVQPDHVFSWGIPFAPKMAKDQFGNSR